MVYSITETAILNGLNPYDYLTYLLERMKDLHPFPSKEDLLELLPWPESIPELPYQTLRSYIHLA